MMVFDHCVRDAVHIPCRRHLCVNLGRRLPAVLQVDVRTSRRPTHTLLVDTR